jgi:hypothetical protein
MAHSGSAWTHLTEEELLMKSKVLWGISLALSFIFGFSIALAYFSDYDLLSKYVNKEIQLTQDMRVSNSTGQVLTLPKGSVLYYEKTYNEVDHLLIKIIAENIEDKSSLFNGKNEHSLYFAEQAKHN